MADDDGVELTSVVVDVIIPEESDGMAFRDSFFEALADALRTCDLGRLAVGVGRLEPSTGDSFSFGRTTPGIAIPQPHRPPTSIASAARTAAPTYPPPKSRAWTKSGYSAYAGRRRSWPGRLGQASS